MGVAPIGTTSIMRVETPNSPGAFGVLALAIVDGGDIIGAGTSATGAVRSATSSRSRAPRTPALRLRQPLRDAAIEEGLARRSLL